MNAALPNAVNMKPKFTFTFSATDGNCSWFSRNTSEPARNLSHTTDTEPHLSVNAPTTTTTYTQNGKTHMM